MVFLGLLLVILSGAAVGLLAFFNRSGEPTHTVTLFGNDVATVTGLQIFVAGIGLALVFCFGLWIMTAAERRRRALRAQVVAARQEADAAASERDRLAEQLTGQQQSTATAAAAGRHRSRGLFHRRPAAPSGPATGGTAGQ